MEYSDEILKQIFESLDQIEFIRDKDIPTIPLYMDQVTTFMNQKFKNATRNPEEDKMLTKTMINNYAKNDLLPPPTKKKYSKDHILMLTFIYYYKGMLSISDIQTLLKPLTESFFEQDRAVKLEDVYKEVFQIQKGQMAGLKEDIAEKYRKSYQVELDVSDEEKQQLQLFYLTCELAFDVYLKNFLIEKIIDDFMTVPAKKEEGKNIKKEKEEDMQKE